MKRLTKNLPGARPDKLLLKGLKTVVALSGKLYSLEKSKAKGNASITYIGEQKVAAVATQLYTYNLEQATLNQDFSGIKALASRDSNYTYWLNFHGLHEIEKVKEVGGLIGLDRVTLRQTLDTTLRPKVEEFDNYLFFSIKSILPNAEGIMNVEQLSFVLGNNFVVSFQEQVNDHFDYVRHKVEDNVGLVRQRKADFLLYQLLDAILDNYFETLEKLNAEVAALEAEVLAKAKQESLIKIEKLKQAAELIKKSLKPFNEALRNILNLKSRFINKENGKFYKEMQLNAASALEESESTLAALNSLANIYFSALSHKMNETMKVLTTVSTIFIPLTFIAGVYGMNFTYMPELQYRNAYFIVWGVMLFIGAGLVFYFKRRRWL